MTIPKEMMRQVEAKQAQPEVQQNVTKKQVSAKDRTGLGLSQWRGRLQGCCKERSDLERLESRIQRQRHKQGAN